MKSLHIYSVYAANFHDTIKETRLYKICVYIPNKIVPRQLKFNKTMIIELSNKQKYLKWNGVFQSFNLD